VQAQMQNQVLHLYGSVRKRRIAMTSKTQGNIGFDVENCRAKNGAADLVDCLSPKQAHLCSNSLAFGNGYFCSHPRRKEFVEITEKLRIKVILPSDIP
jgi:hypothetical protein